MDDLPSSLPARPGAPGSRARTRSSPSSVSSKCGLDQDLELSSERIQENSHTRECHSPSRVQVHLRETPAQQAAAGAGTGPAAPGGLSWPLLTWDTGPTRLFSAPRSSAKGSELRGRGQAGRKGGPGTDSQATVLVFPVVPFARHRTFLPWGRAPGRRFLACSCRSVCSVTSVT